MNYSQSMLAASYNRRRIVLGPSSAWSFVLPGTRKGMSQHHLQAITIVFEFGISFWVFDIIFIMFDIFDKKKFVKIFIMFDKIFELLDKISKLLDKKVKIFDKIQKKIW